MCAFELWKDGVTIHQRDGDINHLNSILTCDIRFEIMKVVDWTKQIIEAKDQRPVKFIGVRSNGQVVVEHCGQVYITVDPQTGQCGFLNFINKPEYKYVPFDSYEEVIPLIGTYIKNRHPRTNHDEYQRFSISGILIGKDKVDIIVQYGALPYEYCCLNSLFNRYVYEDTKEPVGKKVEV